MGYVEGQNLVLDIRHGEGKTEAFPALAAELVRLPVTVLGSTSVAATRAAQAATSTIPIVFTNVTDPVDQGLIASWAQPGEHITGVANGGKEAEAKRLEFLRETVPAATRIAVLVPVDNPAYRVLGPKTLWTAARELKMDLHLMEVRNAATNLEHAFAALVHERVEAITVLHDPSFGPHIPRIVALVAESRLPAIYDRTAYVQAGGLMAYQQDDLAILRRAASWWAKSCGAPSRPTSLRSIHSSSI
jgi:putative ABC transport system substrate-binding protein